MKRLCVIVLFIASLGASPYNPKISKKIPSISVRIINGDKASPGQFPWQASIFVTSGSKTHLCGGALIDNTWILTAGHCVYRATSFKIGLGSTLLVDDDPNRVQFDSTESILHESYNHAILANDIGLIKLPEPVEFNFYIQPIALTSHEIDPSTIVTVSGWGLTSDDGDGASPDLNYVNLLTIPFQDCKNIYSNINSGVVCAKGQRSDKVQSTCEGDSGGPLVIGSNSGPVHVGVVSFGHQDGCESGKPAAFSRTDYYRDWIRNKTGI